MSIRGFGGVRAAAVRPSMGVGVCFAVALIAVSATWAADVPEPAKKPNWTALDDLLVAGDYAAAVTAADEIVATVTPKRRAPDFLARSIDEIRALMRRGLAELRLGRLDAADETFTEAHRVFKDRDFQRLVGLEARQGGPAIKQRLRELELSWIELQHLRMTVVCERLRLTALGRDAIGQGEPDVIARLRDEVGEWLEQYEALKRAAGEASESFMERRDEADAFLGTSPYRRSLVGTFRTELAAGITALELSRLPGEIMPPRGGRKSAAADAAPPADESVSGFRERMVSEAIRRFDAAATALGAAIAASSPGGGGLKQDGRIEAAIMEAEVLAGRASALRDAGDLAGARAAIDRVVELLREVNVQRRRPNPDVHPDLVSPLLLSAELAIVASQERLDGGDIDAARGEATRARATLERLASLPVPKDHPVQGERGRVEALLQRQLAAVTEAVPRSDAADAAARRLRKAIDAASESP